MKEANIFQLVDPLLNWFDQSARVLPWREKPTPYHVWVSEIMLQQTRVEAVKPYYDRFLQRLPDVESLAAVSDDELLKLWEGLGYYNRARNLKKAANQVLEEYQGIIPSSKEQLLSLAGIGSYTAGAIASIAYDQAVPAVDGNVLRVISRVLANTEDILDPKTKKKFEELVEQIIPKERPGAFNQALMELGAMVCVPNGEPKCNECPWNSFCEAKKQNLIDCIPHKASKKPRTIEKKTVLLLQDENRLALRKRPDKGLLAGMYEFPCVDGQLTKQEVIEYLHKSGIDVIRIEPLLDAKHIFTHKEWHMRGYAVRVDELQDSEAKKGFLFVDRMEIEKDYPIPSAYSAYYRYMNMKLGPDGFME